MVGLAHHECIHENLKPAAPVQQSLQLYEHVAGSASTQPYKGFSYYDPYNQLSSNDNTAHSPAEAAPADAAQRSAPIRIVFDTSSLDSDPGLACDSITQSVRVEGKVRHCNYADLITPQKRELLEGRLLPEAAARFASLLRVQPVVRNLHVTTRYCGFDGGVNIPEKYRTEGVPDADIVLFVTMRPIGSATKGSDTIAYAGHCETDQHGRPTVAHFNWAPMHLPNYGADAKFEFEYLLSIAMHEITHALVFSPTLIDYFVGSPGPTTSFVNTPHGGYARAVVTPAVVRSVRHHFNCDTLVGAPLEDGGGAGTGGSHWEMRLFRDEYMTGSASPGRRAEEATVMGVGLGTGRAMHMTGSRREGRAVCPTVVQSNYCKLSR